MGAQINGIGSDKLVIEGVERLHGATYRVMPDRIEAVSYACAAAITGGSLEPVGANAADMHAILAGLRETGVTVEERTACSKVSANWPMRPLFHSTPTFPAFPTHMPAHLLLKLTL